MTNYVDTLCPACDVAVHAQVHSRQALMTVRGEKVFYTEQVAICPRCGKPIGDARLEKGNLDSAYAAYRAQHDLVSAQEIKELRSAYGLSLRDFGTFVGMGDQTLRRYELGDIPSEAHNNAFLLAKTPAGAQILLSQRRPKMSDRTIAKVRAWIAAGESTALELA